MPTNSTTDSSSDACLNHSKPIATITVQPRLIMMLNPNPPISNGVKSTTIRWSVSYSNFRQNKVLHQSSTVDWLKHLDHFQEPKLVDSTRIQTLVKLMHYIRHQWLSEKVVIFSSYLPLLDIIARKFKLEFGLNCLRFDGSMPKDQKQTAQLLFDRVSGSRVMLITSGSGGVGLNIQCASIVVQTEIWWNENYERQAYARCHRQGQKREVKIFGLYASNSSIDRAIRQAQERKTATNNTIMSVIVRAINASLHIPSYD